MYNEQRLTEMLMDEVSHSWQLILPCKATLQIPNAVLAPLGLIKQDTIMSLEKSFPNGILSTIRVLMSSKAPVLSTTI